MRNETTATSGSSVVITCNASGIPEPELEWEKDGEPVNRSLLSSVPSRDYFTVEELTIQSLVTENSGEYTCIAMNEGGSDRMSTLLRVVGMYIIPYQ